MATPAKGTGDLLAALLLARRLEGHDWPKAVEMALSSVFEIVAGTAKAGADELMLAELQTSLAHPHASINVRRMQGGIALAYIALGELLRTLSSPPPPRTRQQLTSRIALTRCEWFALAGRINVARGSLEPGAPAGALRLAL